MSYDLNRLGIDGLNAMQQEAMQAYRKSQSIVLLSPTGSGKTLAYLLPLLESLESWGGKSRETAGEGEGLCRAMVIVPSRELAMQTQQVVRALGSSIKAVALYGGRPAMEEHRMLRGVEPQLVVGTPGRLLDHLTKGNLASSGIETLIIDEFDKCLELGFRDEMTQIFAHLPNVRKRVLLSATDNPEITRFLPDYLRLDYLDNDEDQCERIQQFVVRSPVKDKLETARDLLLALGSQTTILFVGFRESVERVYNYLREQGFYVSALHGGMEQRDRERALFRFTSGSCNILVSTDLASRGLDIPELDNVVHYHLPLNAEVLVHRNGRTARWDREGRSFLIVGPEESLQSLGPLPALHEVTDVRDLADSAQGPDDERPSAGRGSSVVPPIWDCLYIGKGKKDKLSRGDIAGFLMKVGGLDRADVGRIEVREHQSYVAVRRSCVSATLPRLRGQKIKGMKTIIERIR